MLFGDGLGETRSSPPLKKDGLSKADDFCFIVGVFETVLPLFLLKSRPRLIFVEMKGALMDRCFGLCGASGKSKTRSLFGVYGVCLLHSVVGVCTSLFSKLGDFEPSVEFV